MRLRTCLRTGRRLAIHAVIVVTGAASAACSNVLDAGQYHVGAAPSGESPASADAARGDAAAPTCNVDLTGACHACTASSSPPLVNGCTSSVCVPFDDTKRLSNLLPDGGLPPLPSMDGG